MKKSKKIIAFCLAAAMALAPATVFAAPVTSADTQNGTGGAVVDGDKPTDIFSAEMPTTPTVTNPTNISSFYDFIVDPKGLVQSTGAAKYDNLAIADDAEGLYFVNYDASGDAVGLSGTSDALTIENKGTQALKVNLKLETTTVSNVTFTDDKTFASDDASGAAVYLELVTPSESIVVTGAGAASTTTAAVLGARADVYAVSYDGTNYTYVTNAAADAAEYPSVEFKLRGTANQNAAVDWTGAAASIKVTWEIAAATEAYAVDDGSAVYLSLNPFVGMNAPDVTGLEGAKSEDIIGLNINGTPIKSVVAYDCIEMNYSSFGSGQPPYTISFMYNGEAYFVTLLQ